MPDMHMTHVPECRNRRRKMESIYGAGSEACVMGIMLHRSIAIAYLSVRLSVCQPVCLPHAASIVTKHIKLRPRGLHHRIATSSSFSARQSSFGISKFPSDGIKSSLGREIANFWSRTSRTVPERFTRPTYWGRGLYKIAQELSMSAAPMTLDDLER